MDDRGEFPDPTHQVLKDAIRYGIGAWVLFLGEHFIADLRTVVAGRRR